MVKEEKWENIKTEMENKRLAETMQNRCRSLLFCKILKLIIIYNNNKVFCVNVNKIK